MVKNKKQSPGGVLWKKLRLKVSQNSEKTPVPEFLFDKVTSWRPATLSKTGSSTDVFPINFAKFSKTYFEEHLQTAA